MQMLYCPTQIPATGGMDKITIEQWMAAIRLRLNMDKIELMCMDGH